MLTSLLAALTLATAPVEAASPQKPAAPAAAPAAAGAASSAKADPDLELAKKAALEWLAHLDSGRFEASFDEAALSFQKVQKKPDWAKGLSGARGQVGKFLSRAFLNDEIRTNLPNLPPGKYITVRFKTVFAKYATASESVTLVRDGKRGFRTIAYFLG